MKNYTTKTFYHHSGLKLLPRHKEYMNGVNFIDGDDCEVLKRSSSKNSQYFLDLCKYLRLQKKLL